MEKKNTYKIGDTILFQKNTSDCDINIGVVKDIYESINGEILYLIKITESWHNNNIDKIGDECFILDTKICCLY